MQAMIKKFIWTILLAVGLEKADGFALLGPIGNGGDSWQQAVIGYGSLYIAFIQPGGPVYLGDIGAPKNIGEEYRRNVKTLYYAYDQNFSGFFGLDGETAVDGAFAIMNSLTNVDSYSPSLSEFPVQSQHINDVAAALFLTDIKSVTLHLLVEQMGLAQPERYTWTLHNRFLPPGGKCPFDEEYIVVQRNFDIMPSPVNQVQYSPYVNDVLYTYGIEEFCTGPNPLAVTVPFSVDPLAEQYTAVAANDFDTFGGLQIGGYYTGLTRDDVGGLRYLIRTNNINLEAAAAGARLETTNFGGTVTLTTSNLSTLLLSAQTNEPIVLLPSLFPGLLIATNANTFTTLCTPNIVGYFTNYIGSPAGTPSTFVIATNGTTCVPLEIFTDTFANVITNQNFTNNPAIIIDKAGTRLSYSTVTSGKIVTITLGTQIGAPAGSPLVTNVVSKNITLTNVPSGEYILIPAGQCGWEIISTLLTNVVASTNVIAAATNANGFVASQSIVTLFTNHTFIARPINCLETTNAGGQYQGVGRVQFVRVPDTQLDPLTHNFLTPITNSYTMVVFDPTNSQLETRTFHRIITTPDIVLSANDQANGPGANLFIGTVTRNINFDQSTVLPGLAGPGVIDSPSTFSYNKVGAVFWNVEGFVDTNSFLLPSEVNELTQIPAVAWASFDGSTNDPEVYPNGTSIQNYENQLVITITPTTLPDAENHVFYSVTFSATGGVPPYTWSIAPGTSLPPGLTFSPSGVLSGTPSSSGTYDFTIELTDSQGRVVALGYSLTID